MTEEEFSEIIRSTAVAVGEARLADHLHVSLPTIRRWSQGQNLPYNGGGINLWAKLGAYVIKTFLLDILAYHVD